MVCYYIADYFIYLQCTFKHFIMKNLVISVFGKRFNNRYVVLVDGDMIVYSNSKYYPAARKMVSYSADGSIVELWYQFSDGSCRLLECFD